MPGRSRSDIFARSLRGLVCEPSADQFSSAVPEYLQLLPEVVFGHLLVELLADVGRGLPAGLASRDAVVVVMDLGRVLVAQFVHILESKQYSGPEGRVAKWVNGAAFFDISRYLPPEAVLSEKPPVEQGQEYGEGDEEEHLKDSGHAEQQKQGQGTADHQVEHHHRPAVHLLVCG